jgi:hypothetical protein
MGSSGRKVHYALLPDLLISETQLEVDCNRTGVAAASTDFTGTQEREARAEEIEPLVAERLPPYGRGAKPWA